MLIVLFSATLQVDAQTTSGTTGGQNKTAINKQEKKRLQRGASQYYGKKILRQAAQWVQVVQVEI
ncbi:hypothetical protein [Segetibacter koreensis]|uniref:hypothetical protein n=1 Tax=Segetibacter koreensis TaxID=398037 RepID=UPI00146DF2E3|nr:hypothetical protein [Segetibacter koreensis]